LSRNGKVTLFGEVFGYTYGYAYPMGWEFMTRSVDSDRWRSLMFEGSYRQSLTVEHGANFWFRFRSDPYRTEGRVYRLDFRSDVGQGQEETWVPKVAYFNDSKPRSLELCNRHSRGEAADESRGLPPAVYEGEDDSNARRSTT
jgi:hypothetical protein